MFDELLKNYYIIPIFSTLIIPITFGINNWDMTDIEKKLVTRFKRLQIELSLMLIETVMIGICLSITLNEKLLEPFKDIDDGYLKILLICITLFTVIFPLTLSVHVVLLFVKWLLVPKKNYYVMLDNSNEEWFLKRAATKGQILLENKKSDCIFIKDWDGIKFNANKPIPTKMGNYIYKNRKQNNLILFWLLFSIIILTGFCLYFLNAQDGKITMVKNIIFVLSLTLLTVYFVIVYVRKYYFIEKSTDASK